MMESFDLFQVVENYNGPPLKMVLSGLGSYVMRLLEVPGASSVVDSIYVPYSRARVREYLERNHPVPDFIRDDFDKTVSVSQIMCEWLHAANCSTAGDSLPLTMVGAITSKKQRQGDNHAYIAAGTPKEYDVWHVQMSKLDSADFGDANKVEAKRFIQDRIAGEVALSLATGIPSDLSNEMMSSGYVHKV